MGENGGTPPPGAQPNPTPAMENLVQQLVQQNERLMQQLLEAQRPGPPQLSEATQKFQVMRPEKAPQFRGAGSNFENWLELLGDWEALHTSLAPSQKAGLLVGGLSGEALLLARAAVKSAKLDLTSENAYNCIVEELTKHYGTNKAIKEFTEFQRLISVTNTNDNLESYIRQYTIRVEAAREQGLTLPERLCVFMLLNGSGLGQSQLQQVLTTAEQMASADKSQEIRMSDVQHLLRSMAQARNLRVSGGRRVRSAFVGVMDEEEQEEDEWCEESEDAEWSDDDIDENPEYIAAVAQFRKKFWSKKGKAKGNGKGKSNGKSNSSTSKGKGPKGGKSGNSTDSKANQESNKCKFPGKTPEGEMRCWSLKDNKKCTRSHAESDLVDARENLRSKGMIPTFNAWDARENFKEMSKSFMHDKSARMIIDPGAKKSVCGQKWLEMYERQLRKVSSQTVKDVPLKRGERRRVFQFGGGLKVSEGRKRLPMWINTGDLIKSTHVLVDVVPGYLPLLFGYDAQKYHKVYANPVTDKMYEVVDSQPINELMNETVTADLNHKEILNCCVDKTIGIMTMDMLNQTLSNRGNVVRISTEGERNAPGLEPALVVAASSESTAGLLIRKEDQVDQIVQRSIEKSDSQNAENQAFKIRSEVSVGKGAERLYGVNQKAHCESIKVSAPVDRESSVKVSVPADSMPVDPSLKVRVPSEAYVSSEHGLKEMAVSFISSEVHKGQKGTGIELSKQRIEHIHTLTKCTLSVTALKKMLKRAAVSNIQQCVSWYKSITAECGCARAEYQNRHRLPRLKLQDLAFNSEIELDLMDLCGTWFLVIVDRGTRFMLALMLRNKTSLVVRHSFLTRWVHMFGAPIRGISDCGSEFMSRAFLEATDLLDTFKECTPAYASDRHALVERTIRTLRESAERAIMGLSRKPTIMELEEIVAICCNQSNNDLQACGSSASERAFGRNTSPFLSLLQRTVPPAESDLRRIQEAAREAWRQTANDRTFSLLLTKQLGPQATITAPEVGDVIYYRRPDPRNDSPQFRGPAEVVGVSVRSSQAYVVHGGLLIRAAFEHLKPLKPITDKAPMDPKIPDGKNIATYEELDERDGEAAIPPDPVGEVVPVSVMDGRRAPLESSTLPDGCELGTPLEPSREKSGGGLEASDMPPLGEPVACSMDANASSDPVPPEPVTSEPDELKEERELSTPRRDPVEMIDEISPGGPAATDSIMKAEPNDWFADGEAESEEVIPEGVVVHDMDESNPPLEHPPDTYDDVRPAVVSSHGLSLGDRLSVMVSRTAASGRTRSVWETGRVVDIPEENPDRVRVEWMDESPELPESVNLSSETWKQLRASKRTAWEPKIVPRHRPALVETSVDLINQVANPNPEVSGGTAAALIAAIEARLEEFKRTGGGNAASVPRTRSVLAAVAAHGPMSKAVDTPVPTTLSRTHSEQLRSQIALPEVKRDLESIGVIIADCFPGNLYVLLKALLQRDTGIELSDRSALSAFKELGRVYPVPDGHQPGRTDTLRKAIETLLKESDVSKVSPHTAATVLVLCERGLAESNGEVVTKVSQAGDVTFTALQDTAVHEFSDADLTDQMRLDGAKKEMSQFEEFKVFGGEWVGELPPGAKKIQSRLLENCKIREGKLVCKSRLVGKGFQDPERFSQRNDSPTATRVVIYTLLAVGLSHGWEWIKNDALCAFLNGDIMERQDLFLEAPEALVRMGFVKADRRFRRLQKAVYGLNEAPRRWFLKLARLLLDNGLVQSLIDSCLFLLVVNGKTVAAVVVYVDDLLMGGLPTHLAWLDNVIKSVLPIGTTELSKADSLQVTMSYVGRDIVFKRKTLNGPITEIEVNQSNYIESKFSDEFIDSFNPGKRSPQLLLTASDADWFRTSLGRLMWTVTTRPDLAYDVSEASSASQAPTVGDAKRLQKVMRTLSRTSKQGICIPKIDPTDMMLVLYTDGSYANVGTRTQGGHVILLCERSKFEDGKSEPKKAALLSWISATIKRVCTSTFDSEILSLVRGADEQLSVAYLISEMTNGRLPSIWETALTGGFGHRSAPKPSVPMLALTDGESVVSSVYSSKVNVRNKRRRVDIASLRELTEDHEGSSWRLEHVDTKKQVADALTKRMDTVQLREVMKGSVSR